MVGRFHPATRRLKEIVDSGELGTLTKIEPIFFLLLALSRIMTFAWYTTWVVVV